METSHKPLANATKFAAAATTANTGRGLDEAKKTHRPSKPGFKPGQIDWISCTIIFAPHLLVLFALFKGIPFTFSTFLVICLFYLIQGLGITMGYHRLFSHRAYTASKSLQWFLAIAGAGAFEGSIKWWGRNHRIHHRYVDTDSDPYNAKRGFYFTHIGWMLTKPDTSKYGHVDVSDFKSNPIIMFQHKNYLAIAIVSGVVAPVLLCGLIFGDWAGGFFYGAMLKMMFLHHSTFFINSLAHTSLFASQNFSDHHTSHDSVICALLTLGEGYHNFHHEFAQDYRNGIRWYHWDPTKWVIRACEICGSATNLIRIPNDVIKRNVYDMRHQKHSKVLEETKAKLNLLNKTVAAPAVMEWSEFETRCAAGEKLCVVGDYVLDLKKTIPIGSGYTHKNSELNWYENHPGGKAMLDCFVGKDATDAMSGGIYKHSQGAFNLVQHLRVANIRSMPSPTAKNAY